MQERIGGPYEPTKPDSQHKKTAEEKTNPVLFDQIKQWVSTNARAELLLKALGFLEILNQQQMDSLKGKEKLELPEGSIAKKAAEKVQIAKNLLPLMQEFEKAMGRGDGAQAGAWLRESVQKMADPNQKLPQNVQKEVNKSLKPLLQTKNASGKSTEDLLFKTQLGQTVVAAQGNWGDSEPMILSSLMDKIKQLANAVPPNPLTDAAKDLLQGLQTEGGDEAFKAILANAKENPELLKQLLQKVDPSFKQLLENPKATNEENEKALAALLKSAAQEKDASSVATKAAKALSSGVGPKTLYETYLQEFAAQVAASSTQESQDKTIKAQKQFFMESLQMLKKAAPGNASITKVLSKLIAIKFPPENDKELADVNDFTSDFFETYNTLVQTKALSPKDQREFIEKIKDFCDESIKLNEAESDKQTSKIAALRQEHERTQSIVPHVGGVKNALTTLEDGDELSATQLQNLTEALAGLSQKYPSLSPQEQHEIDALNEAVTALSSNKNALTDATAAHQLNNLLTDFASTHKNPRVETLMPWLNEQLASLKQKENASPFWSSVTQTMEQETKKHGFPGAPSLFGENYATVSQDGVFNVNPALQTAAAKKTSLTAAAPKAALYQTAVLQDTLDEKSDHLQTEIQGRAQASKTLEAQKKSFYGARAEAENKKLMTPSSPQEDPPLPWQFAEVIFGKVIPNQDEQLIAAGTLLSFFNQFSSGCNNILQKLTGWDSDSYGESTWFSDNIDSQGPPAVYNLTPSAVETEMTKAMGHCSTDFQNLQGAVGQIQSEIDQINKSSPLSTQQTARLTQLQGYLNKLINGNSVASIMSWTPGTPIPNIPANCAAGSISQAYSEYSQVWGSAHWQAYDKVQKFTDPYKSGTILPFMQDAENDINTGAPGTTGTSLKSIYQAISNDQTAYSGYSQQQQMQLQLTMTQTQQMFSTITSAMQDLNQSYTSIAQAISK